MNRFAVRPIVRLVVVTLSCCAPHHAAAETIERDFQSGPVQAKITLDPKTPLIGDTVALKIEVTAEDKVEVLMPAFGDALDRFSITSFVEREDLDEQGRSIQSQSYQLQPPTSGKQAVPPILVEYVDRRDGQRAAPEGFDAYELLTERIEFEVQSVLPDNSVADLKPPLGKLDPMTPPPPPKWPWGLGLLIILGCIAPFAWRAFQRYQRLARRRSAYEIARARFDRLVAKGMPDEASVSDFFVHLSNIVRRYLEDRFELRAPELTTEEFLASVGESPDLSADHQGLMREFLRQADLVKFAGVRPNDQDIQRSIDVARRFLEETRENAPLLEEAAEASETSPAEVGGGRV